MRFTTPFFGFVAVASAVALPGSDLRRRGFADPDNAGASKFSFDTTTPATGTFTFGDGFVASRLDRRNHFKAALEDAITLANFAKDMPEDHPVFAKYFFKNAEHPTIRDFDNHYALFKGVMSTIADPSKYKFIAGFGKDDHDNWAHTSSSVAGVDEVAAMIVHPPFFAEEKNGKTTKNKKRLAGVRYLRSIQPSAEGNDAITAFEGIGHTTLHELTHLNTVAEQGGLPVRLTATGQVDPTGSHGTVDWENTPSGVDNCADARRLKEEVLAKTTMKEIRDAKLVNPILHAESYAAAATEYWIVKHFPELKDIPSEKAQSSSQAA